MCTFAPAINNFKNSKLIFNKKQNNETAKESC